MNPSTSLPFKRSALAEQLRCACMALAATLAAAPAGAVNLPDEPLQSSGRVSPNILFILDDSGSMSEDSMPDVLPGTTPINIAE
ncbi:hypothetical protein [Xanthomonas arboricola]|nr:hypothetical protein [Xanthomonas arboricola]